MIVTSASTAAAAAGWTSAGDAALSAQKDFDCPRCGYAVDAATGLGDTHAPRPGDISLCLRCGCPMEFGDGIPPRWLVYDELVRLDRDVRARIVQAILHIITMRPSGVHAVPWRS